MSTLQVLKCLHRDTKAEVFLVGGYVRDLLRNKSNDDIDVVVRGLSLHRIKKYLADKAKVKQVRLSKTNDNLDVDVLLVKAHGDTVEAQVVLPRRGKKQIPNSHNTLRQDSKYRDFKLNALYLPIDYTSKKDVIDLVGGKEDIAKRVISSNGSAVERIKESPIRMMRAIALAARLGYTIDQEILDAIQENKSLIEKCPIEAVREKLDEILLSRQPSKYIRLLSKVGLLAYILPELDKCVGVKQDRRFHKYDVFRHLIYTCDNTPPNVVLRLSGLLHDIGKVPTRREIKVQGKDNRVTFHKHEMVGVKLTRTALKRLRYDNETIKQVLNLVKNHMYHYTREWTDSAVRKFIKRSGMTPEFLREDTISEFPLFQLRMAERAGNGYKSEKTTERQRDFEKRILDVRRQGQALDIKDLDIDGHAIMDVFKIKPGVEVGRILSFLLEAVLEEPEKNSRMELLKLTTEYICNSGGNE